MSDAVMAARASLGAIRKMAAALAFMAITLPCAPASALTAEEMRQNCKVIENLESLTSDKETSFAIIDQAGRCMGAFDAMLGYSSILQNAVQTGARYCLPENATVMQIIQVFMRHVEKHQSTAHNHFTTEAWLAFRTAFPCKG